MFQVDIKHEQYIYEEVIIFDMTKKSMEITWNHLEIYGKEINYLC